MADLAAASVHYLRFRIQWSSIAVIYYDYALTFSDEVRYIWLSKFRLSTVLYVLCRCALLINNVLYLLGIANLLGSRRSGCLILITVLSVLGRFAVIATFTARTYAVYGRNWKILAFLGCLGALCVACDIITPTDLPGFGQDIADKTLSISMSLFEGLASCLTAYRSSQMLRSDGRPWMKQTDTFAFLVFKQSIVYFSLISMFPIASAVLNFHAETGSFYQRILNAFTLPVSMTLTARFLISLRVWEAEKLRGGATQSLSVFQAASQASQGGGTSGGALSALLSDFGDDVRAVDAAKEETLVIGKGKERAVESSEETILTPYLEERHVNAV